MTAGPASHPPLSGARRPRVLIAYASRMGSTREIAEAIAAEFEAAGFAVTTASCAEAPGPADRDAVIIGSALYTRRWEKSARDYLKTHRDVLAQRRVWLFQSGPCGEGAETEQVLPTGKVARLAASVGAELPRTFGGRLDLEHATGPISRWMAASGPLAGDFRDWDLIRGWARNIADQLALGGIVKTCGLACSHAACWPP